MDDDDRPIAACAAKRLVEMYYWAGEIKRPLAVKHALSLLHDSLSVKLRNKGYNAVDGFIPMEIAKGFGRVLERKFGWVRNLESWTRRL